MKIFFHFNRFDELDTFNGTYQKDLIPGLVKTRMWLTKNEQEIILNKLDDIRFFSLPDTVIIASEEGVALAPDFGVQRISVQYGSHNKTILWHEPTSPTSKVAPLIGDLSRLLLDLIHSKPEFKALPPTKGAYQ